MSKRMKKQMEARQEKLNLRQLSPLQRQKYKKNPNLLADNSEEYLIYKLKQQKKLIDKEYDFENADIFDF